MVERVCWVDMGCHAFSCCNFSYCSTPLTLPSFTPPHLSFHLYPSLFSPFPSSTPHPCEPLPCQDVVNTLLSGSKFVAADAYTEDGRTPKMMAEEAGYPNIVSMIDEYIAEQGRQDL